VKFKIAFAFSRTERELRLHFGKWDLLRLSSTAELSSIGSDLKAKIENIDEEYADNPVFQALFYPEVESRIWRGVKKLISKAWNLFSVKFENIEVKGTLGEPFYDSIAMGIAGGCYYPDWENENGGWSTKGEMLLKVGFFRFLFFVLGFIYEFAVWAFILWRGARLAKKNPNGENLEGVRKWIFLKFRS